MRTKVHDQVNVVDVLEKMDQTHQILMIHRLLYPDFSLQFGFSVVYLALAPRIFGFKVCLRDYLACKLLFIRSNFNDSVTSGEASFAQPLSFYVAFGWAHRNINDQVHRLFLNLMVQTWLIVILRSEYCTNSALV